MSIQRCDYKAFGAKTMAATGPSLLYGVMLSSRAGGASLIVYDHSSMGTAAISRVMMRVYTSSSTGTTTVCPPLPIQLDLGCMLSMSAKGVGTVFISRRK